MYYVNVRLIRTSIEWLQSMVGDLVTVWRGFLAASSLGQQVPGSLCAHCDTVRGKLPRLGHPGLPCASGRWGRLNQTGPGESWLGLHPWPLLSPKGDLWVLLGQKPHPHTATCMHTRVHVRSQSARPLRTGMELIPFSGPCIHPSTPPPHASRAPSPWHCLGMPCHGCANPISANEDVITASQRPRLIPIWKRKESAVVQGPGF